jgi:hypothetical protein
LEVIVKIKVGATQMSVNDKTVSVMDSVLDIVAQYNAELAEVNRNYAEAKQNIDKRLDLSIKAINNQYEAKLLGAIK